MPDKELPVRPNLEQYKKQAKDLARACSLGSADALARIKRNHPRFYKLPEAEIRSAHFTRTDAQLVLAREHGFESWPKFVRHIETLHLIGSLASLNDPVAAFIEVACVPRHSYHGSGTLEHAELILARYPQVASANVFTTAILADEAGVRGFLARDPKAATATGGPHGWDALTHLCFSRYLRLDGQRAEAFVGTARALLDAGSSAKTGWYEMIDQPNPRPAFESAIYGAAGIARHLELSRLLLEYGADPNDEETPYHVPEGYDNEVMKALLESGKLNQESLTTMLLRKTDWHDADGIKLVLERGANPNAMTRWGHNALHQALRRDNGIQIIELLLDHGADPALKNARDGRSATVMGAHRGRGDVLALFEQRGLALDLHGVDRLIAACARDDSEVILALSAGEPTLVTELIAQGGTLLAEFAGVGNVAGMRNLLDLGVEVASLYAEGDPYFDIAKNSTALHVASWRAWPAAVKELIARGAPVDALDAKGRTALTLAAKACVDSYWKERRSPDAVEALLRAGASPSSVELPTGYEVVDDLLAAYSERRSSPMDPS
jgi:ankyrin repeat protein